MSDLSFKNYFKDKIIVEDTPVAGDFDEWYPSLRRGVSRRSEANDVYLFKDIAQALNITVAEAVDHVSTRLFNKLFPNNQPNPSNTEEEFRNFIFNALTEIINEINAAANTNIKNSKSQKTYTSRIISALGQTVKTFDGVAPRAVRETIRRVNQTIVQEEPEEETQKPITEIEKLKLRLFVDGFGNSLKLTKNTSKILYGIKDPENVTLTDKAKLLKVAAAKAKNAAINIDIKTARKNLEKINNFYGGIFQRDVLGDNISNMYASYITDIREDVENIKQSVLRFKFTLEEAKSQKLVSSAGVKFIDYVNERYNTTASSVYIHFVYNTGDSEPSVFVCVPLITQLNGVIYFTERQRITKPMGASRRSIVGKEHRTIGSFYSASRLNPGYRHENFKRKFYL